MKNQFCRVGDSTPITQSNQALLTLEYHYQKFASRAAKNLDSRLNDFFEGKARSFKKMMEELS